MAGAGAAPPRGTIPAVLTEPEPPPPAAPKPPRRVPITPADSERFSDEDLMRRASNDDRLRDERPPHHQ
jgi:hypothetical protein